MLRWNLLVSSAGVAVTFGFMVWAGDPRHVAWWVGAVPFALWASAPYAVLAVAAWALRSSRGASLTVFFTGIGVLISSFVILVSAFVTHIDAQSGLVFVFLPLWQLIASGPLVLVALVLRARGRAA
jgi:hypothetical protein